MLSVLNWILNTFIRDISMPTRTIISIVLFICAVFSFMNCLRKKNDNQPLSIGWSILCVLLLFISSLYILL